MEGIGAISSYALAMQQLQLNLIKQTAEMQQQVTEILLNPDRMVTASNDKGTVVDVSI